MNLNACVDACPIRQGRTAAITTRAKVTITLLISSALFIGLSLACNEEENRNFYVIISSMAYGFSLSACLVSTTIGSTNHIVRCWTYISVGKGPSRTIRLSNNAP